MMVGNLATCQRSHQVSQTMGSPRPRMPRVSNIHIPSSPHSQSFHSQSAIMCLHTSLAIITSCSVITHPGPDITCPPMSSPCFSSHRVHSDVPRFKTKYAPISAIALVHAKYQGADFLLDSHPISAPRHLPAQLVCYICCA